MEAPMLFLLMVSMTAVQSQIRKGPANALKKVGDSVTLVCVTVNKNCDQVEWQKVEGMQSPKIAYRNGIGMLNSDLYPTQRYSVNSTGGCNLTITQLEISDSGRFMCVQTVGSGEETRTSILVVIGVRESCLSNVTNNALDKGDGYSLWCTINIPLKSVEPSNVTLSFHNKTVGETETTDDKQPLTVKKMLTGTAKKESITQRVCRASFPPNTQANYDNTTAILDICSTQQLIVSPVQSEIERGPANALKKVGDIVTLECVTVNRNCEMVEWQKVEGLQSPKLVYRNGQGMLNNDSYPPQRYSVNSNGGCSLTITQLEINDSGRFVCMQVVDDMEQTRSSILVVIDVTESCMSNVTSTALDKGDGYSIWCAINIPAKSVEPSNVTLSFHNKIFGETEITDERRPLTVRTALTGTAREENITQRVCRASFFPKAEANYDNTTATLDICATQQLIVSSVRSPIPKGPANALNKVGDSVTLECFMTNKNCDQVEWQKVEGMQSPKLVYRNGYGMLNKDLYPPQRYSVNESYGCSLTIMRLEMGDSGRFICVLAVDSGEEARGSILVVINASESCESNVTSNALDEGDGYSFWCAINIPPKSVEPSNLTLSFHNKTAGETDKTDENQPLTVKTTLTGTATKENITSRGCRASFAPKTEANYDNAVAFLDVCTTEQLIVSYSVEKVTVSPSGPYSEGDTVRYTTDVHPFTTFKSTHSRSVDVVGGDTLEIKDDAGDEYSSTATNTFKGREASQNITIEVSSSPPPTRPNPVESSSFSTPGPYSKSDTVGYTTNGYPSGTLNWTRSNSEDGVHNGTADPVESNTLLTRGPSDKNECLCPCPVDGVLNSTLCRSFPSRFKRDVLDQDTRVIMDDEGKTCTFKATKFKGSADAQKVSSSPTPEGVGPGGVAGAVCGTLIIGVVIGGVAYAGLKDELSPLYARLHSSKKKKNDENGEMTDVPSKSSGPPTSNVTPSSEDA